MEKSIVVKLRIDGTHQWRNCPIKEVEFLKDTHRHLFFIRLEKTVTHNDRDIEIIQLKHSILQYLRLKYFNEENRTHSFGNMSCEDIAQELLIVFEANLVEVLEDNENGAIIRL
tara:strand:- start:2366 stop:2707 length:342 start_codon:yes stop_codon:yes gene_type:complete